MKPSRERRQRLAGEALPPLHLLDGVLHFGFLLNFAHYLNVRLIGDRRTNKFANQARPVCYQHSDGIHSAPRTNQTTEAKYGNVAIREAGSIKTQGPIQNLRSSELGKYGDFGLIRSNREVLNVFNIGLASAGTTKK